LGIKSSEGNLRGNDILELIRIPRQDVRQTIERERGDVTKSRLSNSSAGRGRDSTDSLYIVALGSQPPMRQREGVRVR